MMMMTAAEENPLVCRLERMKESMGVLPDHVSTGGEGGEEVVKMDCQSVA